MIILSVEDDGPGISDDDKDRVFEMFYTAAKHTPADGRRGLGLGLALCQEIVQAHHGTIKVSDAVKRGSVFTVALPEMKGENIC